ncbi:MAG: hypothetical protein WCK98_00755 [bacterium]
MPQTQKYRLKILYFQPDSVHIGGDQLESKAKEFAGAWGNKEQTEKLFAYERFVDLKERIADLFKVDKDQALKIVALLAIHDGIVGHETGLTKSSNESQLNDYLAKVEKLNYSKSAEPQNLQAQAPTLQATLREKHGFDIFDIYKLSPQSGNKNYPDYKILPMGEWSGVQQIENENLEVVQQMLDKRLTHPANISDIVFKTPEYRVSDSRLIQATFTFKDPNTGKQERVSVNFAYWGSEPARQMAGATLAKLTEIAAQNNQAVINLRNDRKFFTQEARFFDKVMRYNNPKGVDNTNSSSQRPQRIAPQNSSKPSGETLKVRLRDGSYVDYPTIP